MEDVLGSGGAGGLALLFASAFLAATILPASSELVLGALARREGADLWLLFAVATLGNTLGSAVNWGLGRFAAAWRDRPWFPLNDAQYERASRFFRRFGIWCLPFAWVPVVGDPLTVIAGMARVRFLPFFLLVGLGKGARYAAVLAVATPG